MSSLLSHLYSRIKGSPEDVATMSLCYVLENSSSARQTFTSYLSSTLEIDSLPDLFFRTQVAGKNRERPDLVGFDGKFNELILCESKFWAGLTENQPLGYLRRLHENKVMENKALIFICPSARVISLWGELLRICEKDDILITGDKTSHHIKVNGIHMAIVSWRSVIDVLMQTLSAELSPLVGDLQQLQGLCETMDENAFSPFTPEDFGVDKAQRIINYYSIVDKVSAEMINRLGASTKGLKATPQRYEYSRYLSLSGFGISVKFSCKHWIEFAETPFWLTIKDISDDGWTFAASAHDKLRALENKVPKGMYIHEKWKELVIPLYAPASASESDVVDQLYNSTKDIFEKLGVRELIAKDRK